MARREAGNGSMRIGEQDSDKMVTAKVYMDVTFAKAGEGGKGVWAYHEGSFYPFRVVLNFLQYLEKLLTTQQIFRSALYPEEFWLQAWVIYRESGVTCHKNHENQQICGRYHASDMSSMVPKDWIQRSYAEALRSFCDEVRMNATGSSYDLSLIHI